MEYRFLDDPEAVVVRLETADVLVEAVQALSGFTADARFRPGMAVVYDGSGARGGRLERDDLQRFLERAAAEFNRGDGPVALVVRDDHLAYGLARMTEQLARLRLERRIATFRDLDSALDWLRQG